MTKENELIDYNGEVKKNKGKVGRPSYSPSPEQEATVRALAAFGSSLESIAEFLKIDPKTLSKHHGHTIKTARMALGAKAVSNLHKGLYSPNEDTALSSTKFYLTTVGRNYGWSTSNSTPPDPFETLDFTKLDDVEFEELMRLFVKAGLPMEKLMEGREMSDRKSLLGPSGS